MTVTMFFFKSHPMMQEERDEKCMLCSFALPFKIGTSCVEFFYEETHWNHHPFGRSAPPFPEKNSCEKSSPPHLKQQLANGLCRAVPCAVQCSWCHLYQSISSKSIFVYVYESMTIYRRQLGGGSGGGRVVKDSGQWWNSWIACNKMGTRLSATKYWPPQPGQRCWCIGPGTCQARAASSAAWRCLWNSTLSNS